MNAVEVVAVGLNRMMEDILISSLMQRADTKLVGSYKNIGEFLNAREVEEPDIVLTGMPDYSFSDIFYRFPRAQFVCIGESGRVVNVWQLSPRRVRLGDVSPEYLVEYLVGLYSES